MGKEIERKYLIKNDSWKNLVVSELEIKQGYLNDDPERVVRVRVQNQSGFITVKSKIIGLTRLEYEYEIPFKDAVELLKLCKNNIVSKKRYIVDYNNEKWEVDIFSEENKGLELAEIELNSEDKIVDIPDWIGQEISKDKRYLNSNLALLPYQKWKTN